MADPLPLGTVNNEAAELLSALPLLQSEWKRFPLVLRRYAFDCDWVRRDDQDVLRLSSKGTSALLRWERQKMRRAAGLDSEASLCGND
jgi:hypothetical protein